MPLYSYRCRRGNHVTERIKPMDCSLIACPVCGNPAHRDAANRVCIVAPSVDTRNMTRRYIEATAEMDYNATRIEQSTGQPVQTPPFWQMAKQRAQAQINAGEAPAIHQRTNA